jgi:hypothetical protein
MEMVIECIGDNLALRLKSAPPRVVDVTAPLLSRLG